MEPMTEEKPSFVSNMMTICNWGGIPATDSREVAEVLRFHISNMKQMPKDTLEFKAALEAAKVLDKQYHDLRLREQHENTECLWVPERTWKPLGEAVAGGPEAQEATVSSDTSEPKQASDPKTTPTEAKGCAQ